MIFINGLNEETTLFIQMNIKPNSTYQETVDYILSYADLKDNKPQWKKSKTPDLTYALNMNISKGTKDPHSKYCKNCNMTNHNLSECSKTTCQNCKKNNHKTENCKFPQKTQTSESNTSDSKKISAICK